RSTAAVDRILLPRLGARVVEMLALRVGRGDVRLLDASDHLLVERFLQFRRRRHHRVGGGVLFVHVGAHRRVLFLPQPEVVVFQRLAVHHDGVRNPGRSGWFHRSDLLRAATRAPPSVRRAPVESPPAFALTTTACNGRLSNSHRTMYNHATPRSWQPPDRVVSKAVKRWYPGSGGKR